MFIIFMYGCFAFLAVAGILLWEKSHSSLGARGFEYAYSKLTSAVACFFVAILIAIFLFAYHALLEYRLEQSIS